jgi:hypothetical protein
VPQRGCRAGRHMPRHFATDIARCQAEYCDCSTWAGCRRRGRRCRERGEKDRERTRRSTWGGCREATWKQARADPPQDAV